MPNNMSPYVSIIIPCYNEEKRIRNLLKALLAQTYPRERLEVLISDGLSEDGTRQVLSDFQIAQPDITLSVLDNPRRTIPAALNQALRRAKGEIIIRLDAHSIPRPDYVERCVSVLSAGLGDNVGGVWEIQAGGDTWIAQSIALAAAHPLGVGDALYRLKSKAGPVDTVPFGSFRRSLMDRIGFFDESLLTNEDYEFNARLREAGGSVWLDPSIRSTYFARANLVQLAQQYWRYGFWKWRMLRRYPRTLKWRQALPPLFMFSLISLSVLSLWIGTARLILLTEFLIYFIILGIAGLRSAIRERKLFILPGLAQAIAVMHFCWGAGFLWSMLAGWFAINRND